jgi:glutamyl-tRNA synthetase
MGKELVRVRFAPSPSGSLHLGSARTALLNFLYANHHHGVLILRIEDTDTQRSNETHSNAILQMLEWLGISWNEGPYYQSQRHEFYQEIKHKLLASGKAYPCFCSRNELEQQKEKQKTQGLDTVYPGTCRSIPHLKALQMMSDGLPYTIRLKLPDTNTIKFNDLIKGELVFKTEGIGDFVLFRQDNTPTYHFAVVVDDAMMKISHVIRGEDHLSNTPKQIALYHALDFPIPQFAHLPLILGPDKAKLSKRHGETSIEEFREKGILPRALMVYLFHLGYPVTSSNELPSIEEMIEQFDLYRVSSSPSIFDLHKLNWINRKVIQESSSAELYPLIQTSIKTINLSEEKILQIIALSKHQAKSIHDFYDLLLPFSEYSIQDINPKEQESLITADSLSFLTEFMQKLLKSSNLEIDLLERIFDDVLLKQQTSKKDAVRIVRFCATGRLLSPSLFETLVLIGIDELKRRYQLFLKKWA